MKNFFDSAMSLLKKLWANIEAVASFLLIAFIGVFPLLVKFLQEVCHLRVIDSDVAILNFVFLFACLAGFITWHKNRHLSLAAFSDKLPHGIRGIVEFAKTVIVSCMVLSLFFDSLCQLVNPIQFTSAFWKISEKIIFAFLPLCYLGIFCLNAKTSIEQDKTKGIIAISLGALIGIIISSGTILGSLYYIFGIENVGIFDFLNNWWLDVSHIAMWPFIVLLIASAFMGVPLFLVLAAISYILFSQAGGYVDVIPIETHRILTDRNTAAIPLFTIAGYILSQGSAANRFVYLFKSLFGSFRGGTVVAAVIVTTFFSTFTGVSGVTILALGSLLSIVLVGGGYSKDKAESLVTATGALGLLFPPSAAIIMYATVNYFSVDVFDLFKAAIIPGILMLIAMIALGIVFDKQTERPPFSAKDLRKSFLGCIPELLMPILICVFYFKGFFDLFETSAFAVVYAYILSTLGRRDFNFNKSCKVISESVPVSGGVIFILGAASGISYFILDANVPAILTEFIQTYVSNKYVFLMLMNIVLLFVGCIMDMFSAILIVSPLLLPIAEIFGVPAVQAAVIFLMNLSVGFLTPPVGMDLFISSYAFNKGLGRVVRGILPFLLVQFAVLMLVTYVPWFTNVLL